MSPERSVHFDSVLLIEDEAAHALLIKRALKEFASDIQHAQDLSSALAVLEQSSPDLIVTDLNLPDSSNVSHIEKLKVNSDGAPIVVLTSSTSLKDAVKAMQLGARDFMVKNFDSDFREVLGLSLSRLFHSIELENEKRRLQKEMEVLRLAIENSSDALAVIDSTGQVQYSNYSFELFAKRSGGEIASIRDLFSSDVKNYETLRDSILLKLENLSQGAVWSTEVGFCDDKNAAYDLSLSVIETPDQPDLGALARRFVVWVRDISEVKRREQFQREILSTTTHDLKGPLGAISLSSEILSDMLQKETRPYDIALRMGSSAKGAINLIDEFLSARRLQEGTFILKPSHYDVGQLIDEVIGNFDTIAEARSIALIKEEGQEVEAFVDKIGFTRVLGNLLSNALKFTPKEGKVWIRYSVKDGEMLLEVEDNGSGMEASEIQTVFGRFSRLEKHGEIAGTGLGLFVVKNIVSAHGGKIDVTSKVGQGTAFQITFPFDPPVNERGELIALDFA